MPQPPDQSLRGVQLAFASGLADASASNLARAAQISGVTGPDGIDAPSRLRVYANNARHFFVTALARTYPVLRLRTGEQYFDGLAADYREQHPSRHGDLHWIGSAFPDWLERRTQGTAYAWLADLARLEWACESAWGAAEAQPLGLEALAGIAAEPIEQLLVDLQPSVRLVSSPYPIWTVWQSNQGDVAGEPVALDSGAEHCLVTCAADGIVVYRLEPGDFALIQQLAAGKTLGASVAAAAYDPAALPQLLAWLFAERLVTGLRLA